MKPATAGAAAGLVAGAIVSGARTIGADAGVLKRDLSAGTQEWLDETFHVRRRLGYSGTELLEQAGHYLASAGLGMTYAKLRPGLGFLPGVVTGALFGAGVYAFGVAGVLPELGVTQGEPDEPAGVPTQRFLMHLLYGAVMGLVAEGLAERPSRHREEVAEAA